LADGNADWEKLMKETMEVPDLEAPETFDFLTSDISLPVNSSRVGNKGKGKKKVKGKS